MSPTSICQQMDGVQKRVILGAAACFIIILVFLLSVLDFAASLWILAGIALAAPVVLPGIYATRASKPISPVHSSKLSADLNDQFDSIRILPSTNVEAYFIRYPRPTLLVSRGALDQLNSGELRALVAHETGHHELNHISRLVLIRLVWVTVWSLALTTTFSSWSIVAICAVALVVVGDTTVSRAWLRLSEFQADRYAAEAISKEDYYRTLSKLESSPWNLSLRDRLVSSHPPIRDRVRYLEQL